MDIRSLIPVLDVVFLLAAAACGIALGLQLWNQYARRQNVGDVELTKIDQWLEKQMRKLGVEADVPIVRTALIVGIILALFVLVAFGVSFVNAVLIIVGALAIEVVALRMRSNKNAKSFSAQLGDALPIVAAGLKSGLTLSAALESYCENAENPIKAEFTRVANDVIVGISFPEALTAMAERMQSKDAQMLATTVAIQAQTGAPLADIIEQIAATIKERERLRAKCDSLTATNRMSGLFLTAIPVLLIGWFCLTNETFRVFYFSTDGLPVLAGIICMLVTGNLILRRMTDLRVD